MLCSYWSALPSILSLSCKTVLRSGLFNAQKSGSSYGFLHCCIFGLEATDDAQNVRVNTARGKDNDEQNP